MTQPLTCEQVLAVLRESPARIATVAEQVALERLRLAPAAGAWSVVEVLAHLRACADMWGGAIRQIVTEDHPTFRAINPMTWVKQTDYPTLDFPSSFAAFQTQRAELLTTLAVLPPEGWERTATVTVFHKSFERTVNFYAAWLARHERTHVKQIERTIAAMR